jgi:hypothetical protein
LISAYLVVEIQLRIEKEALPLFDSSVLKHYHLRDYQLFDSDAALFGHIEG